MKKFIASLIAAFMMTAGLVAFTSSAANAACPYVGCAPTSTRIDAPNKVKRLHRARIGVKVTTPGNATPKGQVTIRVTKRTGGYVFTDTKRYTGSKVWFRTSRLKKTGKYIVRAVFDRKPGSAFKDSDNFTSFRVVRR